MSYSANAYYVKEDDVVVRSNQDGTMIMMKMDDSNVFFKIEGIAAEVLKGVQEGKKPSDIISTLLDEYETSVDEVTNDVEKFINEMMQKNLLKIK